MRSDPEWKTARGKEDGAALLQGQGDCEDGLRKGISICDLSCLRDGTDSPLENIEGYKGKEELLI